MSKDRPNDLLEDFIHDMNSGCASLREAALLLRKATPDEAKQLLTMMDQKLSNLARKTRDVANLRSRG